MNIETNLSAIFTTGLLTGGLSCLAVQGGLLTSALAQKSNQKSIHSAGSGREIKNQKGDLLPVLAFMLSKLVAYTILGFFLGWLGSIVQVGLQARIILQFAVAIFMLGTALDLLQVHPVFRYFQIQPPIWLMRKVYKRSEDKGWFAPVILGFLTVLIPCGATQAMMALAVGSGNPVMGAVILFTFVLGTSPTFFVIGSLAVKAGGILKKQFIQIAAYVLILLALFNIDASLALANSPHTFSTILKRGYCIVSYCDYGSDLAPVTQQAITFTPTGYSPNRFAVRAGTRVTLNLVNKNAGGCIQAFTISALNIQKIVLPSQSEILEFTAPDKPGKIIFTCSAGFYPGTIEIL